LRLGLSNPATQADTCRDVSTDEADQKEFSSDHDARDTRDENENVDVLPLDSLIDTDNPRDARCDCIY